MRSVLLYDFLLARGGAEAITLRLADSPRIDRVVVSSMDPAGFTGHPKVVAVDERPPRRRALSRGVAALHAFTRASELLQGFDTVIYSGHFALAAAVPPGVRQVYYAHSLPLGRAFRSSGSLMHTMTGLAHDQWLWHRLRAMDRVAANSRNCARAYTHARVPVRVVRPPVDLAGWRWEPPAGYYLSLARHEPNKRVDAIVRAFVGMPDQRLVVAGSGSRSGDLHALAAGAQNVRFVGACERTELQALAAGAIATIHVARAEALGLVVLESLAAGKPVIASSDGAHAEVLVQGSTGLLLGIDPSPMEIAAAVRKLDAGVATTMREACMRAVDAPGVDEFLSELLD